MCIYIYIYIMYISRERERERERERDKVIDVASHRHGCRSRALPPHCLSPSAEKTPDRARATKDRSKPSWNPLPLKSGQDHLEALGRRSINLLHCPSLARPGVWRGRRGSGGSRGRRGRRGRARQARSGEAAPTPPSDKDRAAVHRRGQRAGATTPHRPPAPPTARGNVFRHVRISVLGIS